MTPDYITEFREKFVETYRALELAGHIPNGSVSEVVNWDELESFITKLVAEAEQRGKYKGLIHAQVLISKHDPQTGYEVNPAYWGSTLRKELSSEIVKANESARTKQS